MIVGTAGHIDHGKTALVRALTGVDTDRLPEEKRRGITIELGFAPLALEGVGIAGVVDVPGHEGFIRTMVAGATGVDVALLIVAADEGVMPQTREHLTILGLLEVGSLVVALTKADLVGEDWLALVRDEVADLLAATAYRGSPIIATSTRDGRGIGELKQAIAWALKRPRHRSADDLFRLPVDRAFTVRGAGTVVTGTVWSGRVSEGESVRVFPLEKQVRVRGIECHGRPVASAGPGDRAAIALASVDLDQVARGSQLVSAVPWPGTTLLHANVVHLPDASPWRPREWLRLHVGTVEVGARVVPSADGAGQAAALARIVLDTPLLLRSGDRFVLRRAQPLSTVGGGTVIDPTPLRRRSRPLITGAETPGFRLTHLLAEAGSAGLAVDDVPIRLGVAPSGLNALLQANPSIVRVAARVYLKQILDELGQRVVSSVVAFHASHPLASGMPLTGVRPTEVEATLADALIERLVGEGRIELAEGTVRIPGWRPRVTGRDETHLKWIRERLEEAGSEPPSTAELRAGIGGNDPVPVLRILEREGIVVQVEPDRFYDAAAVAGMMQRLRDEMRDGVLYAPTQLREVLGVSRKFLMPFLEYCDRQHVTERRGNGRVLARQLAR